MPHPVNQRYNALTLVKGFSPHGVSYWDFLSLIVILEIAYSGTLMTSAGILPLGGLHKDLFSLFRTFNTAYSETLRTSAAFGKIVPRPLRERVRVRGKRVAFTLAEVLITLGIIGVVAAMTMPTLIANQKRKVVETRLAKFYSVINQAIKMSEVENGELKDWLPMVNIMDSGVQSSYDPANAISAEEWYRLYLSKYIQTIKAEASGDSEQKYNLYFADGSMVTFSGSSWVFYPDAKYYKLSTNEDTGLTKRNTDVSGKYNFTFVLNPSKEVEPYAKTSSGSFANLTDSELKNSPSLGCYIQNPSGERAYCAELIRRNGWKLPKDYPWIK